MSTTVQQTAEQNAFTRSSNHMRCEVMDPMQLKLVRNSATATSSRTRSIQVKWTSGSHFELIKCVEFWFWNPMMNPSIRMPSTQRLPLSPPETREEKIKRPDLDPSCLFHLRRYHSEPNIYQRLSSEREFQQYLIPKLKKSANTMEDAILSSCSYPTLVRDRESPVSGYQARTYEISETARRDWEKVSEQETQRFSFYDQLFKRGYIVDSLEVPTRTGDVSNLIEADVASEEPLDYCRMVFKSKTVFTGNLHRGHFSGPGRYIWVDGTIYQGNFLDGLMHGEGLLLLQDGCFFEGQFNNGERTGWGIYTTPTGLMYAGDWLRGLPHGKGKVWYNPEVNEGDYYDGQWKQGVIHGNGTRQYPNGDRYVGNFQNGIRLGPGTMVWLKERQVYKGEWLNGEPNGFGEHAWYLARSATCPYAERNVYKGDFVKGQRHGIGRMVYACGSIYDGKWQHGVKHGKGIFVNPAGELLFAIFRQGSISGGAEVPLHVPTYACKFRPLVTVLQQRLHTTDPTVAEMEEEYLSETVTRFLCRIRSLYKRAGYLGQWYGNQGHYPQWMKKQDPNRHHLHHRRTNDGVLGFIHTQTYATEEDMMEEPWLLGHKPHYGSPDHVNPVTRFGLWLLLKDCPGVLADITLADLDAIWNTVPSISFQTRHHPFEPVQLWQFLQCLVVVASMLYIEIPKQNYHYEVNIEEDEDVFANDEGQKSNEDKADAQNMEDEGNIVPEVPVELPDPEPQQKQRTSSGSTGSGNTKTRNSGRNSGSRKSGSKGTPLNSADRRETALSQKEKSPSVYSAERVPKIEEATAETQTEGRYDIPKNVGEAQTDTDAEGGEPIRDFLLSEAFELFLTDFLIPCLERRPGKHLPQPPNPLPSLADLYAAFNVVSPYKDVISARDFLLSTLQHRQIPTEGNCIYWTRSRNLMTPDIDMEKLLTHFAESTSTKEDNDSLDYDFLSDKLSNTEIYTEEIKNEFFGTETKENGRRGSIKIFGPGNVVFGEEELPQENQDGGGDSDQGKLKGESDNFDNVPLGEEDLTPVPFLWATEPVCTRTLPNEKTFDNVGLSDVLQILRQFYPKTCDRKNVINLEFNLTFGDWIWLTIVITKLSTDRAFCAWMQNESSLEHKRERCRQMGRTDHFETAATDESGTPHSSIS